MIIKSANLETVCGASSRLPVNTLPEFAFAGRSNVGKSSLINALMNRRSYARVSAQPGKTRTLNYYNINGEFYFVDLPGYGYAKVPEEERAGWGRMVEAYLRTSRQLRRVFLLVDIRHEPGENDRRMALWLQTMNYAPALIATKADKIARTARREQAERIRRGLVLPEGTAVLPFSARTGEGRDEIYEIMEALL